MNKYEVPHRAYTDAANDPHFMQESESMNPGPTSKYPIDPMWEVTSKYYIDRLWEEYHKVKNDLAAVRIEASSAWQEYHKMKEELADTKCKLGQMDDYVNEVLKPELADTKLKLKMAQSAWDELDKSHASRAKLHDELIIAEGQRDQAKMRAETAEKVPVYEAQAGAWLEIVGEHAAPDLSWPTRTRVGWHQMRVVAEHDYATLAESLITLRAERDARRKVDDAMVERALTAWFHVPGCYEDIYSWEEAQKFRTDGGNETRAFMHRVLTAALAVQP